MAWTSSTELGVSPLVLKELLHGESRLLRDNYMWVGLGVWLILKALGSKNKRRRYSRGYSISRSSQTAARVKLPQLKLVPCLFCFRRSRGAEVYRYLKATEWWPLVQLLLQAMSSGVDGTRGPVPRASSSSMARRQSRETGRGGGQLRKGRPATTTSSTATRPQQAGPVRRGGGVEVRRQRGKNTGEALRAREEEYR